MAAKTVKGGRLEFLVPHLLRSQLLRPQFVRMSLRLGVARQMPSWAKLQFLNCGVTIRALDRVLDRVTSLEAWVDEWERLGNDSMDQARVALAAGERDAARDGFLTASAAYNFAQYVIFMDVDRKKSLHTACIDAYANAAPMFDIPAVPFEVPFRRRMMRGYLRVPPGEGPAPVVIMFNGTNAVKEELHWWTEALLARGLATVYFDGPGLGDTFHRLSMVAEPRPVGLAIVNEVQSRPELDPEAIAMFGQSLGGYLVLRMASFDARVRAVAAVSPPYSAEVYWNVTLSSLRNELAGLYGMTEAEMGKEVHRITLQHALPHLYCPMMISAGGHDLITPHEEAWRVYEEARCDREMVFYPRGGHDCFNVLGDLQPRMVGWLARQLKLHRSRSRRPHPSPEMNGSMARLAAEAVDEDFADALTGDAQPRQWNHAESRGLAAHFRPTPRGDTDVQVILRRAAALTS